MGNDRLFGCGNEGMDLALLFGSNVFNDKVIRERLPKETYKALKETIEKNVPLKPEVTAVVANAMKDWTIERGATHYTHWFQPLTGTTAEKHDSFISPTSEGGVILGAVDPVSLIVKRSTGELRDETYETGMATIGSAWMQFTVAYYIYALIFLAFDVDVLYLFPVALAYGKYAARDFIEVCIFVGILSLAIVYAWRKGVFEWPAKQ